MKLFRQALTILLINWIILFLTLEVNSLLSPLGIYFVLGGMFVVYPAFQMSPAGGLPVVLLTGAIWDALTPVPFGLHLFSLGFLFAGLYRLRNRLRSRRSLHQAIVASGTNLLLLVFLALWFLPGTGWSTYFSRFFVETIFSTGLVFLTTLWAFELMSRSAEILGAQPTQEELQS